MAATVSGDAIPRRTHRLIVVSLTLACVVLAGAACGVSVSPGPNLPPPTSSGADGSGVEGFGAGATPATTNPPVVNPPPAYPGTARAYAEAVLAAWKQQQISRLGELATPLVQDQIISVPGPPNQTWGYVRCDGAAGSSYCVFINNDGDVITLRISNQSVGKAHAATEVQLDQTQYSSSAKDYVTAFVEAWRNANTKRMLALADQASVDYFTQYTPPNTYIVCSREVPPTWQVRIHNTSGLNHLVRIADSARGKPHAITNPGVAQLPPVCS